MKAEDFYHSRPMTFLQRLVSIGYSTCGCCGMPWNFVSKHGEKHIIMISKYEGFFPVCEYCWTHKSYEQNKSAVIELVKKWNREGVIHYNQNLYTNAFEEDWKQKHITEQMIAVNSDK